MNVDGQAGSKLQGIGVSSGFVIGPAAVVSPAVGVDEKETPSADPAAELTKIKGVLAEVAQGMRRRSVGADVKVAEILEMTAQLATDRSLVKAIERKLHAGAGPTRSVYLAIEDYASKLVDLGGYMAERVTDLYDVRNRAISRLRGFAEPGMPELNEPSVVIADDLAPAEMASLDDDRVLAIVLSEGGQTSHTAILAAGLGIPTVVRAAGASQIPAGQQVAVDATTGEVWIDPDTAQRSKLMQRARHRTEILSKSAGAGATSDGLPVELLVNIGSLADARRAAAEGVEGIGLFRTEFLFLAKRQPPSVAEQSEIYRQVLTAFNGRKVIIRTLDAGADKPLAFAGQAEEDNPALGVRGIRLSERHVDLLDQQLSALALASQDSTAELAVMAPMISTQQEAVWFAELVRGHGLDIAGIMIETPAAALCVAQLLDGLDFASIGTNDLSQYAMAADRMNADVAHLLSPWQPAVLELIRLSCAGAHQAKKPIGICGEAAGDPLLALVLTGLGATSLSMSLGKISAVRAALSVHSSEQCAQLAQLALQASSAATAESIVRQNIQTVLRDLL